MPKRIVAILMLAFSVLSSTTTLADELFFKIGDGQIEFDPATAAPVRIVIPRDVFFESAGSRLANFAFATDLVQSPAYQTSGGTVTRKIGGYNVGWTNEQPPRLGIEKLAGSITKTGYMAYVADVATNATSAGWTLDVRLSSKYQHTPFDLLQGRYRVDSFTPNEARAQLLRPVLHFREEFVSPYPVESIRANFERIATPAAPNPVIVRAFTGAGLQRMPAVYRLGEQGQMPQLIYALDVYPYRNGSKAVVAGELIGEETSPGVVDMGQVYQRVRDQIQRVISD